MNVWLALHFPAAPKRAGVTPILKKASHQIEDYFTGGLREFALPLELWGTPFQTSVWREVAKIPSGETRTYSDIAIAIDNPNAIRAVGSAQAANPLPIVIPCHRVIGTGGRLSGYAGGIEAKQWLLEHEAAQYEREHGSPPKRKPRRPVVGPVARPPSTPSRA